jgi:hypothetical protein
MTMEQQIRNKLKLDDSIDIRSLIDSTLTLNENINNIREELCINEEASEKLEEEKYKAMLETLKEDIDLSLINKITSSVVIGRRGSGKTALSFVIISYANKPVHFYRYPKPHLIRKLGYNIIYSLDALYRLHDCIVYIDEPQHFIKTYDKKANDNLLELLSLARQNNLTVLLSTSDTRFVTKGIESYIDLWFIKDIETELVKNGSLIKKIIKRNTFGDSENFKKEINEFLFYSRDYPEFEGTHTFELPQFWSEEYSKPFRIAGKSRNICEKIKEVIKC